MMSTFVDCCVTDGAYFEYSAPCSSGPGQKNYTFTIYALGGSLADVLKKNLHVEALTDSIIYDNSTMRGNQLLDLALEHSLVLANASFSFIYTRYPVYNVTSSTSFVDVNSTLMSPTESRKQRRRRLLTDNLCR